MAREVDQHPKIVELAEFMMENDEGLAILARHIEWKRGRVARELDRGIQTGEIARAKPRRRLQSC